MNDLPIVVPTDHVFEGDLFTIPAAHVAALRSGLCCVLREAGDETCDILACQHREDEDSRLRFSAAFDRMERARALLLCVIGWAPPQEPVPVDVNLRDHRGALIAALRVQIDAERGLAESLPATEREPVHARVGELYGLLADATAAERDEIDDRREWHLRREDLRWVSVNGTYPLGDEGEEVFCRRVR